MKQNEKLAKPKAHTMKRLLIYIGRKKGLFVGAILLATISNLLALLGPMLSGYAIDQMELGTGRVQFDRLFYYIILMIVAYLLAAVMSYLLTIIMLHITKFVTYELRKEVFHHLMKLPVSYFDRHPTGDIISRISYDIDTINSCLSSDLVTICSSVITVIGSFLMMVIISPSLVLIFLVTVPLSLLLTKKLTSITRPLFRKRSGKMGELNGYVEEMVSAQKTLKAYVQEDNTMEQFKVKNKETVDAYYNADFMASCVGPFVNGINNLSVTLVSTFGAILYLFGKLSLGNISSFVLYSRKFSGPINEAANLMSELQSAIAAAERVFQLLDEEVEVKDLIEATELGQVKGEVSLENVWFGYLENQIILKNVSLTAKPGMTIAIVGPTGAGKTTLINLLMRFYDVNKGRIYVENKEVHHITRASLRSSYAMVLQDTWLFRGTIYENIIYGSEWATKEDVIRVAKAANIHTYIMTLPDGYDTQLTDDGANISKGQKQMLTIARAMLLEASMLILDEATSNVDTRTERMIQDAMKRLMEGKTCFIIAHRLSTIQNADLILVVRDGNIVEQGTHEELLKAQGFYHQLYIAQFE